MLTAAYTVDNLCAMTHPVSLVEALRRSNLSRAQVARMAGITRSTVTLICQRKRTPMMDTAIRIAEVLGVHVEAIDWSKKNGKV